MKPKPCPKCGSNVSIGDNTRITIIVCECGIKFSKRGMSKADTIKDWNSRIKSTKAITKQGDENAR